MFYAVITGDVVGSTRINDPKRLIRSMEYIFNELSESGIIVPWMWEIFKGDSFQLIAEAKDGLKAGLLVRSGLRGMISSLASPFIRDDVLQDQADARLGIGIGRAEHLEWDLSHAYGEAFVLSGQQLEQLSGGEYRLDIRTRDDMLNAHFHMVCRLTDLLIGEWTVNSAQAIYRMLLTGGTQEEAARFLGITQPSVQNRLKIAGYDEIRLLLEYYSEQIDTFAGSVVSGKTVTEDQ